MTDATANGSPIDELGRRAFTISRHLTEISKFVFALGLVLAAAALVAGFLSDNGSGAVGGVVSAVVIAFGSWMQYLLVAGFAVIIEMKAYELFFLEDEDEEEES